tara:strand:- start:1169 stop:1681 length:513 start_codon:yes stop_codon:yes gene_type:complete
MAKYASINSASDYLENLINLNIEKQLIESGKKNSKNIKNFNLLEQNEIINNKNLNKALSLEEDEYMEIELDDKGCHSYLAPNKSTHWCESKKKCVKLNEKCKDWETDINNLKKELLDIDKMNLDDTNLHINKIDVEVDDSIDLNKYGIIECILLLLTTFFLLVFLIKNHK